MTESATSPASQARQAKAAYTADTDEDRPLGSYLALMAAYGAGVAGLAGLVRATGTPLPERIGLGDLALISVATQRLSRLIAKDPVTSPLRAPFTRFAGQSGEAELAEQARGTGPRHAAGELVTCPFCLAQWVATSFAFGMVMAPRATRLAAGVFAVVAVADTLQFGYDKLQG